MHSRIVKMESTKKSSVSSVGILTISDSCSKGSAIDASGPHLKELVQAQFNPKFIQYDIIPDDMDKIENTLLYYADVLHLNLVLTTGGTGFSHRDVTPEATKKILDKEAPQLQLAMSLASLEKTKFAVLSRAVSGIRKQSLIINMPGSKKAVSECFESVRDVLSHAIELIRNDLEQVQSVHRCVQDAQSHPPNKAEKTKSLPRHICPHKTGTGDGIDRNSPYPMIGVEEARRIILSKLRQYNRNEIASFTSFESPLDLPPFRASIKDGYAVKSGGGKGIKKVIGYVSAGDEINDDDFTGDCCYKINTGAPLPNHADCVIQVEDTKVIEIDSNVEKIIEILVEPSKDLDIRPIGNDLWKGERLFPDGCFPDSVSYPAMFASVGQIREFLQPKIGIISTGDELIAAGNELSSGKIYDSNTVMLKELLHRFGFTDIRSVIAEDSYKSLFERMKEMTNTCTVTICTGGVSMGDKDFVKKVLLDLKMDLVIGRVNMKPGKPMTYASNPQGKHVFGLPGNPVSAFVTFHLFVLPALRYLQGQEEQKLQLSVISVELLNDSIELDPRPEFVRATIISVKGKLYAEVTGNQISSRLQSICGADVLLHLPPRSSNQTFVSKGAVLDASVLKHDFISFYRNQL
ncbi:Molybdenum cofactor synthesis protein cinnamon [Pseudolycoriella hygida]|uniref:Molybdenum cofactor synthesis protein cinnamon n=1 Tax=Pseudolycoriella hygida TaxID=35572 RepID=A0A9Q0S5S4_9DIPT|nr:Molybdenum cofactor synthesis protein cinnamon [Pseudolycoriella hygida]